MVELEGAAGTRRCGLRPRRALVGQGDSRTRDRQTLRILNRSLNRAGWNLRECIHSRNAKQEQHECTDSPITMEIHPGLPVLCRNIRKAASAAVFLSHHCAPITSQRYFTHFNAECNSSDGLSGVSLVHESPMLAKRRCANSFVLVKLRSAYGSKD